MHFLPFIYKSCAKSTCIPYIKVQASKLPDMIASETIREEKMYVATFVKQLVLQFGSKGSKLLVPVGNTN